MSVKDFPGSPLFKFYFIIRNITTVELKQAPDGWRESIVEFANSKKYAGLRRNISTPYKFTGHAATIIRNEFYQFLVTANIQFQIQMRQNDLSYRVIYTGKLNFADASVADSQTGFTVPSVSSDFTTNIDAYDGVNYAIPLDDGINLQITPIALQETATLVLQGNSDNRSNAFFQLGVTNNQQNSTQQSVYIYGGQFAQVTTPNWATDQHYFYWCRSSCNVTFTYTIQGNIKNSFTPPTYRILIYDQTGTVRYTLFSYSGGDAPFSAIGTFSLKVNTNDKLFLYFSTSDGNSNAGFQVTSGSIGLQYETQTPATVCKALRGDQLFSKLLTAMNPNFNGIPNQTVPYQSYLLSTGILKDVYFTSSDSIRAGDGSIYEAGDTIGQGRYQVISAESIVYDTVTYTTNQSFSFDGVTTFTGSGYIQLIQSFLIDQVYNPGDSLPSGGTFIVEGAIGESIVYNGVTIHVGTYFKPILGVDTYTASANDVFVKQIAESPTIVTNITDFFQSIKSLMCGNAALGTIGTAVFLEDLPTVYQMAYSGVDLGNVGKDWKCQPAIDQMYSNVKVGYEDQQYDALNGYKEVNSTQEYSSGVLLTSSQPAFNTYTNELNCVSAYRADPYGAEFVRITQADTAASRSNNDTFMFWVNPTAIVKSGFTYYNPALAADSLTSISGVDQSYYNFFLSPKHCLLRGAPYLASIFYNMTDYPLRFASGLKNSSMVCVGLDGVTVSEGSSVLITQLGDALFIPLYYSGLQGMGYDVLKVLDNNPYTYLKFTINGQQLAGFINDFKVNPATNAPQDIKLLLATNNVLAKLIR